MPPREPVCLAGRRGEPRQPGATLSKKVGHSVPHGQQTHLGALTATPGQCRPCLASRKVLEDNGPSFPAVTHRGARPTSSLHARRLPSLLHLLGLPASSQPVPGATCPAWGEVPAQPLPSTPHTACLSRALGAPGENPFWPFPPLGAPVSLGLWSCYVPALLPASSSHLSLPLPPCGDTGPSRQPRMIAHPRPSTSHTHKGPCAM